MNDKVIEFWAALPNYLFIRAAAKYYFSLCEKARKRS